MYDLCTGTYNCMHARLHVYQKSYKGVVWEGYYVSIIMECVGHCFNMK